MFVGDGLPDVPRGSVCDFAEGLGEFATFHCRDVEGAVLYNAATKRSDKPQFNKPFSADHLFICAKRDRLSAVSSVIFGISC